MRTTRQKVPKLESTAAIPSRNDPSMMIIADSFTAANVPQMFSCRKGDSARSARIVPVSVGCGVRLAAI